MIHIIHGPQQRGRLYTRFEGYQPVSPLFCCSRFHRFFCSDAEDLLPNMKALVRLSAPVFLEITVGPANVILDIAKDRGYGPC